MSVDYNAYIGPYIRCERKPGSPTVYDVLGNDALRVATPEGCDDLILIPNHLREQPRKFCFDARHESALVDLYVNMHGEMLWLSRAFMDEIRTLAAAYGDAKIRWGFMLWQS